MEYKRINLHGFKRQKFEIFPILEPWTTLNNHALS